MSCMAIDAILTITKVSIMDKGNKKIVYKSENAMSHILREKEELMPKLNVVKKMVGVQTCDYPP